MRRLLLILMIALLPLRGWVGDVMAMDLAPLATTVLQEGSASAWAHGACPGHEEVAAPNASTDTQHDPAHTDPSTGASESGGACTACQVCHSTALATGLPNVAALPLPLALPAVPPATFASAVPTPGFKPPIS